MNVLEFIQQSNSRAATLTNSQCFPVYSWKFAKSRSGLTPAASDRIDEVVRSNTDLYQNYFTYTDQSNDACFHYPDYEELPPIIDLPGPCDESIRGVPNFDAASVSINK